MRWPTDSRASSQVAVQPAGAALLITVTQMSQCLKITPIAALEILFHVVTMEKRRVGTNHHLFYPLGTLRLSGVKFLQKPSPYHHPSTLPTKARSGPELLAICPPAPRHPSLGLGRLGCPQASAQGTRTGEARHHSGSSKSPAAGSLLTKVLEVKSTHLGLLWALALAPEFQAPSPLLLILHMKGALLASPRPTHRRKSCLLLPAGWSVLLWAVSLPQ